MKESLNLDNNSESIWKPPTFQPVPISFEASSYALVEDEPVYR